MFKLVTSRETIDAAVKGWRVIDIHVPDITTSNEKQSASGAPGSTLLGTSVEDRDNISILFDFYIDNLQDYEEKKSEILRIFNSGAMKLYAEYVGTDRHLDVVKDTVTPSRIGHTKGRISVELSTVNLPYFVSEVDSQIFTDIGEITYVNQSHIGLDNRYTDTEIKVTVPNGTSGNFLEIVIDGQTWRYKKALSSGQTITIRDGAAFIGNDNVIEDTTMNVLVVPPGASQISVRGAATYTLTINTRHYYY